MVIGFTGTQRGMTPAQAREVERQFALGTVLHHGDCVGADHEAHSIARKLGMIIVLHPPNSGVKRAYCQADKVMPPAPYLIRNHEIVDASKILIAAPKESSEVLRSGTWATIRYANRQGVLVRIVLPSGAVISP